MTSSLFLRLIISMKVGTMFTRYAPKSMFHSQQPWSTTSTTRLTHYTLTSLLTFTSTTLRFTTTTVTISDASTSSISITANTTTGSFYGAYLTILMRWTKFVADMVKAFQAMSVSKRSNWTHPLLAHSLHEMSEKSWTHLFASESCLIHVSHNHDHRSSTPVC